MTFSKSTCNRTRSHLCGYGIDAEYPRRFSRFTREKEHPLPFVFSPQEWDHARQSSCPEKALCISFCCKEAMYKALDMPYNFTECTFTGATHNGVQPVFCTKSLCERGGFSTAAARIDRCDTLCVVELFLFGKEL